MNRLALLFICILFIATAGISVSCGGGDDFSKELEKRNASGTKPATGAAPASGSTSTTSGATKPTTPPSQPAGGSTSKPAGSGSTTPTTPPPATGAGGKGSSTPTGGATGATAQTGGSSSSSSGAGITTANIQDTMKAPEGLLTFEELKEKYPKEVKEIEKEFASYKSVNFEEIRKNKSDALWTLDQFWGTDEEGDLQAFNANLKKYGLTTKDIPKVLYDGVGRIDPLTYVETALPEELRPPRSGETDPDAVREYILLTYGSLAVEEVAARMVVYNIIQVGYTYMIQTSYGQLSYDSSSKRGSGGSVQTSTGLAVQLSVYEADSSSVTFRLAQEDSGVVKNKTYFR